MSNYFGLAVSFQKCWILLVLNLNHHWSWQLIHRKIVGFHILVLCIVVQCDGNPRIFGLVLSLMQRQAKMFFFLLFLKQSCLKCLKNIWSGRKSLQLGLQWWKPKHPRNPFSNITPLKATRRNFKFFQRFLNWNIYSLIIAILSILAHLIIPDGHCFRL